MQKKHKYLNRIGIPSNDNCIFNTTHFEPGKMKKYRQERHIYGFDSRETWVLSYTLISWIYSHIGYLKEEAGKYINWAFHKFTIPVLKEVYGPPLFENKYKYHKVLEEEHNTDEIFDIILNYCESYLKAHDEWDFCAEEKAMCAIEIISVIFPVLWW